MGLNFDKVGIIFNSDIKGSEDLALEISRKFKNSCVFSTKEMQEDISLAIVAGGDGTILKCARKYAGLDIPIFGFNLGRLGFLAQASPQDLDLVTNQILKGECRTEERIMLECKVGGKVHIALNDMVIRGAVFSRTSTLELLINNNPTSNYLADGLIVATPTGSTAYALSAGGPVVSPNIECFIIAPICPHTLTARPLVVPSSENITIQTGLSHNKFQLTADGQEEVEISKEITIKRYHKTAKLLLLNREKDIFYSVLREKLHWGKAPWK